MLSSGGQNNGLIGEEQESEHGGTLEVTFHYLENCFDPNDNEYFGLILRRERDGAIIPGSAEPTLIRQDPVLESAMAAGIDAQRRHRITPERPPRSPQPIHTWDELMEISLNSPRERERRAAEVLARPGLDNEPERSTWPKEWGMHHDYFLWTCRGTVEVITDHLQAVFRFNPAINETFVAARLGGVNAYKQITFLRKYLPGEIHSLQRAEARGVIYEADIPHPDVRMGTLKLDARQPDPGDHDYIEPVLPCWAPSDWSRADDAFAALYLGDDPAVFQREYSWALAGRPSIEFIRIRMAQIPHLNVTWMELEAARCRRDFLVGSDLGDFTLEELVVPDGEGPAETEAQFF